MVYLFTGKGHIRADWGSLQAARASELREQEMDPCLVEDCHWRVELNRTAMHPLDFESIVLSWRVAHRAAEDYFRLRAWATVSPDSGAYTDTFITRREKFEQRFLWHLYLALRRADGPIDHQACFAAAAAADPVRRSPW